MIVSRIADMVRRFPRAIASESHAFWRSRPISKDTVLYESFAGNGALCNPEAIFRHLVDHADFAHLRHIWVLDASTAYAGFRSEFASHPRVTFVKRETAPYWRAVATAGYLINNATFPPQFSKREGQIYLNTWHGTPLKRMGFDMPNGALESANTLRNFLAADFLLSANSHMTRQMYASAYKLDGLFDGTILEEGYPRIDRCFLSDVERSGVEADLAESGIHLAGRQLVVFAPTWRGASFSRPVDNLNEIMQQRSALAAKLDAKKWLVVVKLHQQAHRYTKHRPDLHGLVVSNSIPTNALLGIVDLLVTDFSSIFFDYLPREKPIVFFAPDAAEYSASRGLYVDLAELPGAVFTSVGRAATEVARLAAGMTAADKRRLRLGRARFCRWDDGRATERVVDAVFLGATSRTVHFRNTKPRLLLHIGGMKSNGITSAALNLLNEIDTNIYDVSVTYPSGKSVRHLFRTRSLNPNIRQIPRVGGMNGSKALHLRRHLRHFKTKVRDHLDEPWEAELWRTEWERCFGDAHFESLIDFSGYSPFWAMLMLHGRGKSRSIWLHNDMWADAHRTVDGRQFLKRNIFSLFTLYPFFDHLVSVSAALNEVNRARLETYVAAEKFEFASNCIDGETIRRLAAVSVAGPKTALSGGKKGGQTADPAARQTGADREPDLRWLNRRSKKISPVFATIGRLSPEKNQARLIAAFASVHDAFPHSRLIVVGDGPLKEALARDIAGRGLTESVILAGQRANPFAILKRSDCFVLSSDYEGQPMVLLESAVLGVPAISVAFGSVGSVLPPGAITVTEQSVEALAGAMTTFATTPSRGYTLDASLYTRRAQREFELAVGLKQRPVSRG
jgi:CDP-glycerol glycerophosphotransferase (TagB/SpsB family)/glycosyltransferase involved in cell wall biosynthesis